MQECNIPEARQLLKTKRDLRAVKISQNKSISDTTDVTFKYASVDGSFKGLSIEIRKGVLLELLDKELAYTNRMLKSLGVKELS